MNKEQEESYKKIISLQDSIIKGLKEVIIIKDEQIKIYRKYDDALEKFIKKTGVSL